MGLDARLQVCFHYSADVSPCIGSIHSDVTTVLLQFILRVAWQDEGEAEVLNGAAVDEQRASPGTALSLVSLVGGIELF